ncbi:hypothetical protein J6590_069140 [Homalodisca vitripennis]|nr:hypothetical protein J6590_069140 [Homalodisca vitripennis]
MDSSDDEPYSPSDSVVSVHSQSPSPQEMSQSQEVEIGGQLRCKLQMISTHEVKQYYDETGTVSVAHYFSFCNHDNYPDEGK